MNRNGDVAFATPDHGTFKANFQVHGRLKTNLLDVHPGVSGVNVALQTSYEELISKGPGEF
jgi:hypothetical protein